jgi:hypothetical protein
MSERVHITTAIFYCNGAPHVGSAYEALAADTFARALRPSWAAIRSPFLAAPTSMATKFAARRWLRA